MKNLKLYGPFLSMGFNCLKITEPLRRDSLVFTTYSPGVSGTHLIDPGMMKGWIDVGPIQWLFPQDSRIGNQAPKPLQ